MLADTTMYSVATSPGALPDRRRYEEPASSLIYSALPFLPAIANKAIIATATRVTLLLSGPGRYRVIALLSHHLTSTTAQLHNSRHHSLSTDPVLPYLLLDAAPPLPAAATITLTPLTELLGKRCVFRQHENSKIYLISRRPLSTSGDCTLFGANSAREHIFTSTEHYVNKQLTWKQPVLQYSLYEVACFLNLRLPGTGPGHSPIPVTPAADFLISHFTFPLTA
ncbi:hypothetical protein J6590_011078 [Homalodisca vitripennis]|nr:hypothetical protein J6590_011078 [Homalodisca vitripennis]